MIINGTRHDHDPTLPKQIKNTSTLYTTLTLNTNTHNGLNSKMVEKELFFAFSVLYYAHTTEET